MAPLMISVDAVKELFPHKVYPKLPAGTEPNAKIIDTWERMSIQNAMSQKLLENPVFGCLSAVTDVAKYNEVTVTGVPAHNVPAHRMPFVPAAGQNAEACRRHQAISDKQISDYHTFHAVKEAIKQLLTEACPPEFLSSLTHRITGLTTISVTAIFEYLHTTYGGLDREARNANKADMNKPWNPPASIEVLFAQIKDAVDFVANTTYAITTTEQIDTALNILHATGHFKQALEDWDKKPTADKTWPHLKLHFHRFYKNNKEHMVTTADSGYHSANTATTPPVAKEEAKVCYCWTHGAGFNPDHTSATCKFPATGHQKEATISNMMGGNNTIRRKRGEAATYVPPPPRNRNRNGNPNETNPAGTGNDTQG